MGIIQPDLGALYRSIAKEIATLALALATTTTTTKEKPEYEDMVKHYIVASVLLGSMLAGHAHAVTAPHDAGLRKLQQDNYGDQYDPYGVDTDDDYYSSNDGYFYAYPDSYDDDYGDQYEGYGEDWDDDYYHAGNNIDHRYPDCCTTQVLEPVTGVLDAIEDRAIPMAIAETFDGFGKRKLLQDNYGDQYDPYGVDTDDDYYDGGDGYFYRYPWYSGVVDTVVDTAGNILSNTATSASETATGGLLGGK